MASCWLFWLVGLRALSKVKLRLSYAQIWLQPRDHMIVAGALSGNHEYSSKSGKLPGVSQTGHRESAGRKRSPRVCVPPPMPFSVLI